MSQGPHRLLEEVPPFLVACGGLAHRTFCRLNQYLRGITTSPHRGVGRMAVTPMMQQYLQAKDACPGALLLFRMGDFYELFYDDAKEAARLLDLALTSRDRGENATPMAGFPHHQLDVYLSKLIAKGLRVAICDQVEDAKKAKGLVRRDITRVVTPGTLTEDSLLDPKANNFLAAIVFGECSGLAWVELSTGQFQATSCPANQLPDQLARLEPSECLVSEVGDDLPEPVARPWVLTRRPQWAFSRAAAEGLLLKHFGVRTLAGFGFYGGAEDMPAIAAAGAILDYLEETQKTSLAHIERLTPYRTGQVLDIDQATRRSLEIRVTMREGRREGSLLDVLDRTVSAMGSRLLAQWLSGPLTEVSAIESRLTAVEELVGRPTLVAELREELRGVYDMERLVSRVLTGRAGPRDLSFVARTLARLPVLKSRLANCQSEALRQLERELDLCDDVRGTLEVALEEQCPLTSREGGFIRGGFSDELDELRQLSTGGKQWIANYQAKQNQQTGIPNIKIGFNKIFGYYLEVTNTHREKVPDYFIRKQTVKNAERYITPELKQHEEKVVTAEERAKDLEYALLQELRNCVMVSGSRLQTVAQILAQVDVYGSLAELARHRDYCRPQLTNEPQLNIVDGRHPVLDVLQPDGSFVPNSTQVDCQEGFIMIITGPNMAGKSTYIRQVALITLMAQVGSFVPARQATVGVTDRIFARVGSGDELSRGQSTFMVEMTETARILNTATERSLVILDEIGRGTSTYDGISLAWSVVEFLHDRIGCRTLFATHYHELADLARSLVGVRNFNVSVREWADEIIFLYQIVPGAADKSYGIHVARLAGVPQVVNERAKEILTRLEDKHLNAEGQLEISRPSTRRSGDLQLTLFASGEHPLLDELRCVDLAETTPMTAHGLIQQWQAGLEKDSKKHDGFSLDDKGRGASREKF